MTALVFVAQKAGRDTRYSFLAGGCNRGGLAISHAEGRERHAIVDLGQRVEEQTAWSPAVGAGRDGVSHVFPFLCTREIVRPPLLYAAAEIEYRVCFPAFCTRNNKAGSAPCAGRHGVSRAFSSDIPVLILLVRKPYQYFISILCRSVGRHPNWTPHRRLRRWSLTVVTKLMHATARSRSVFLFRHVRSI